MYRLTVEGVEHYILIMRNVLPSSLKVHKKYDLKVQAIVSISKGLLNHFIRDLLWLVLRVRKKRFVGGISSE